MFGGKRPNAFSVSAFYSRQTDISSRYYNDAYMNSYYNSYYSGMYGYGMYNYGNYNKLELLSQDEVELAAYDWYDGYRLGLRFRQGEVYTQVVTLTVGNGEVLPVAQFYRQSYLSEIGRASCRERVC